MNLVTTEYEHYIDLLEDLTRGQRATFSTIIICLPRAEFLSHLGAQIHRLSNFDEQADEARRDGVSADEAGSAAGTHRLLLPTLQLLAVSQHVRLIYCPSIPSLRARLATYSRQQEDTPGSSRLFMVDMLALHHGTSEFTLQGLSRTFSSAVSAANATSSDLTLVECKDARDPTHPDRGSRLWDTQVPLLSGSVKIGLEGSRWSGRALTIRRIASRWFVFREVQTRQASS